MYCAFVRIMGRGDSKNSDDVHEFRWTMIGKRETRARTAVLAPVGVILTRAAGQNRGQPRIIVM